MTRELIAHVQRSEGFRATAYRCPANVWTIGFGRTHGVKQGDTTTEAQELRWLYDYLTHCSAEALTLSPILAQEPPARLAAVEDFVFNCGAGAYAGSMLRKAVDAKDWPEAARQNARWNKGGGKVLPGLVTRRAVTSHWLLTGSHA